VANLARQHMGALIVIQGEDPSTGTWPAGTPRRRAQQPLLESIFDPTPSVTTGGRHLSRRSSVSGATPLSTNTEKIGNLGLRHTRPSASRSARTPPASSFPRSGAQSPCLRGADRRLKSPSELSMILERLYGKKMPKGKTGHILGWFRRNPLEKATAILLASVLWFAFGYQKDLVRRDFTMPSSIATSRPSGLSKARKSPRRRSRCRARNRPSTC